MKVVRPEYEINIRTSSGQRIHGGQGWDVGGAMQTQDYVVSDKSGVGKIKPLVTANLNCAGERLCKCR
jgi:hypothetical protein